ncbi:MAG TPA: hypothetical protein DDY78_17760 [Planctomycetales bacterium]|jgi:hypothetical protein|nr:hypothetical protein [Planctomycetales bacterium]
MRISAKTWLPLLGAGLVALCLAATARAVSPDNRTPADAELVVSIDVSQILASDIYKKFAKDELEKLLLTPSVKKELTDVGLNPLTDIHKLLITSAGTEKPKVLFVAYGKFDVDKIKAGAEKAAKDKPDELKIAAKDGKTIYEGKGSDGKEFFAYLDPNGNTVLASTERDYLMTAIANKSAGPGKEMQDALSKVGGKESIWLAAIITKEMKKQLASMNWAKDLAPKLDAVTGAINVANDVQTNVVIHTTDAKAATDVKKLLNQVKPLLTLGAQSAGEEAAPVLSEVVDNIKITTEENSVKINLKVTEELIEKAHKPDAKESKDK